MKAHILLYLISTLPGVGGGLGAVLGLHGAYWLCTF